MKARYTTRPDGQRLAFQIRTIEGVELQPLPDPRLRLIVVILDVDKYVPIENGLIEASRSGEFLDHVESTITGRRVLILDDGRWEPTITVMRCHSSTCQAIVEPGHEQCHACQEPIPW